MNYCEYCLDCIATNFQKPFPSKHAASHAVVRAKSKDIGPWSACEPTGKQFLSYPFYKLFWYCDVCAGHVAFTDCVVRGHQIHVKKRERGLSLTREKRKIWNELLTLSTNIEDKRAVFFELKRNPTEEKFQQFLHKQREKKNKEASKMLAAKQQEERIRESHIIQETLQKAVSKQSLF